MISLLGTRVLIATVLVTALTLLELLSTELFTMTVSVILTVIPVLFWRTTAFFVRSALNHPDAPALVRQAQDHFALSVASTAAGVLGLLLILRAVTLIGPIPREVFLIGLSYALLMVAAPAVNWLLAWRRP